jgi:hypothetical protein
VQNTGKKRIKNVAREGKTYYFCDDVVPPSAWPKGQGSGGNQAFV